VIPNLRPYQLDLYERLRAARGRGARIIVAQMATGGGKTSVAAFIAKKATEKGKRVLFLVHRRRLVNQISERLNEFEVSNGIIMRGERPFGSALVQVASRDTILSRCFTHIWTGLPPADLVFVDEFHHAADPGSEYRRILEQYPAATILGLTATPVGPDGRGMGPWAQAIECAAPTSQLVLDGWLVPVKCYAPDRKKGRGGKYKRGIGGDLVESWKAYAEGLPTVLFVSRVKHSHDATEAFCQAGIPFAHVDADTPDDERDRLFEELATGKLKGISNVGIAKEGFDVPEIGCIQWFMDPSGRVAFIQGNGRAMRPSANKKAAVLIDHAGAVFRHGFPDEDTEWTLEGNADVDFKAKKDRGLTEQAQYCAKCELLYHGQLACPQCGRAPSKPPRSIFAPPPQDSTDELLVEADRNGDRSVYEREEKIKHWFRCLGVAASRNGTFAMASAIYRKKYNEWPSEDFPCRARYDLRVSEVYPKFKRGRKDATQAR
jgi:DNA repair protein RadD